MVVVELVGGVAGHTPMVTDDAASTELPPAGDWLTTTPTLVAAHPVVAVVAETARP